jgi:hypothetical protein
MNNLLEPLVFGDDEIGKFLRHHVCWCRGHLVKFPTDDRRWTAACLVHGSICAHNHQRREQAEANQQSETLTARQLRLIQRRSEADILRDLGFE